jgi:hypothetical protein
MLWMPVALALLASNPDSDPGGWPYPAVTFDLTEARLYLTRVEEILSSFTALTRIVLDGQPFLASDRTETITIDPVELLDIENTSWECQNIAVPNLIHYLRGMLESQALEILELRIRVLELEGGSPGDIAALVEEADAQRVVAEELSSSPWVD